jgi:hypothetical protein
MGQYYFIVNLDKREFLHPHKFGEGLKLMEFGHSRSSILLALTILLADGNGRGGGDIHVSDYDQAIERWRKARERFSKGKRKTDPSFPNPDKYNQPWIGRWAGDRIVIAGDYADAGKFIEGVKDEVLQDIASKHYTKGHNKVENVTLFAVAGDLFTDISEDVIRVLHDANELPTETESQIRSLRPDMVIGVKGEQ